MTGDWKDTQEIRLKSLNVFEDSSPLIQDASSALKAKGGESHF